MSKEFHIFKQNTDAIAPNRGFYYQYLKTVKLWLDNYSNGVNNEIYCEREDDIFEYNVDSKACIFRQIKCYSDNVGLNSLEIKGSLLHFYDIYQNKNYKKSEFYLESNQTFKPKVGKTLKAWCERQKENDFLLIDAELIETRDILKSHVQDNLDKFLKNDLSKEEQDDAKVKVESFNKELESSTFQTFLESIRWDFSEELDTHKAIANLSEDILKIISEKLQYDNRVDKELLLGYLVNMVLEKSIEAEEEKRLLTNSLLEEALDKTEIDDTLFRSEIKELLKANFFIPHALTNTFKREELFIGREREFEDMKEFLTNENSLLLIHSIGGMGKTTLVKNFLYREQHNYVHYGYLFAGEDIKQSWINSGFRKSLSLVMEKTDEAFTESMVELQALEGKTLLVIDNVENIENQEDAIEKIMGLAQNPNFDIVMTSREIIEDVSKPYELKALSMEDAKTLFTSIYEVEDEVLLEEILGYLDCHTFFIKITAQALAYYQGELTIEELKYKFINGELPKIDKEYKKTFNYFLEKLFSSIKILDTNEILLLKELSILPSVDIDFIFLKKIFSDKNNKKFKGMLNFLSEKGWLIKNENSYKLHQIIKEFILANYPPSFEEIEEVFVYFYKLIENSANLSTIISNRDNLIFFDSLYRILREYEPSIYIAIFYMNLGNIHRGLSNYKKALFFEKLSIKILKSIEKEKNNEEILRIILIWKSTAYNNLSQTYYALDLYKRTYILDKKALYLRREILGDNHIYTIQSYHNLAQLTFSCGKNKEAKKLFEKAITLIRDVDNIENLNMFISEKTFLYSNYASFLLKTEPNNRLSFKFANEAVNIYEKEYGKSDAQIATLYHNLVSIQQHFGEKPNKVIELREKVLQLKINDLGEEYDDVATAYIELAITYFIYKQCKLAKNYINKALAIYKKIFQKENHPRIIDCNDKLKHIKNNCREYK